MNTPLVSLENYLDTSYSPDREYLNGTVVERQAGERPHSKVQKDVNSLLWIGGIRTCLSGRNSAFAPAEREPAYRTSA